MVTIHLTGRITETGELEIKLPEGLPAGEVQVTVELPAEVKPDELPWEERPWTEEEIQEMMHFEPKTAAEIAQRIKEEGGGWEDLGITDSAAWVEEVRRREQERRQT
jgi:hypothetical protein